MLMTRVDEWYGAPEKERARKGKRERERESEVMEQGRGRKRGKKELDGQPARYACVRVRGHVTEQRDLSLLAYPQARSWPDEVMSPPWPASVYCVPAYRGVQLPVGFLRNLIRYLLQSIVNEDACRKSLINRCIMEIRGKRKVYKHCVSYRA